MQADGECDRVIGRAILQGGTLPPPVTAIYCQLWWMSFIRVRAVTNSTAGALASLLQRAVHLRLLHPTGGIRDNPGMACKVENRGKQPG